MAASFKEKNMPTISSNIYGGLQKWVNRASVSIRGRRNRHNSIVSAMTNYRPRNNQFGSLTTEHRTDSRFTPSHSRSRSNPVPMPDTLTFEYEYQKIPQVAKQKKSSERRRKTSSELSDDSSSRGSIHEAKDLTVTNSRLSRSTLSKSESNLVDKQRRSKSLTGVSRKLRRKISQENSSVNSDISELDINDAHKTKSQSSQSLHKTNKRDKSHSMDLTRINKSEQISSSSKSIDEMSDDINTRLDTWVQKTPGFKQYSQNSFDSTSSSEDTFDNNNKTRYNDTKHFRDLQSALDELVSSCGRTSARNSIVIDLDNNNDTKNKRKLSLKNSEVLFNKSVDIECNPSQEERHNVYKNKKCGSSSDSGSSRGKEYDAKIEPSVEICREEQCTEFESSCDSVDGIVDGRDESHTSHKSYLATKDVNDIGIVNVNTNTRGTNIATTDHASTEPENTSTIKNINLANLTITNGHISSDDSPSYSGQNSTESPVISPETKFNFEPGKVLPKPKKSSKKRHAPSPPSNTGTEKTKSAAPVFDDDELTAFALECVEASNRSERDKANSLEREARQNRSDSDEEKKTTALALDYVYIPKHIKSPHLTAFYNDQCPLQGAFSDDECYSRIPNRYLHDKRNSADSLDGLVIFNTEKDIDIDKDGETKFHSSNEQEKDNDNTKDTDKTDYGNGLRKFPSMPLFYVPNDGIRKSSRGKTLWKKLKSLPRTTEHKDGHHRSAALHKTKGSHTLHTTRTDPFYHGEKDQQFISEMRPKSNSMAVSPKEGAIPSKHRSLEPGKLSSSLPAYTVQPPLEDETIKPDNTIVADSEPMPDESQC